MDAEQERIEKLAQRMSVEPPTSLDERIQACADDVFSNVKPESCPLRMRQIGSIIMKSHLVRIAAVIVMVTALILGINLFNRTSHTAWAIEESMAALNSYGGVVFEGWELERVWDENGTSKRIRFKSWAKANAAKTMIEKYRTEQNGVPFLVTDGQKTWRYDVNSNAIRVENRPYIASEVWGGSQLLKQLNEARNKWIIAKWKITYEKDPTTGRDRAVLTFAMPDGPPSPRSLEIAFDAETKLPVCLKQWENPNWEGPADLVIDKITFYETLADNLFEMKIPEGASVIEE